MEISGGEWPSRSKGQVLGKCSTKVLANRLTQLIFTTALSRRAKIQLFPDWLLHHVYLLPLYYIISTKKHAPLRKGGGNHLLKFQHRIIVFESKLFMSFSENMKVSFHKPSIIR
uniref:hypothetical protein n=1 Tax=Jatropha curcas TaxID=180498 RepID=UPI0027A816C0|nr:hypothetical protein QLP06_mgp110 [Jatropha curcas]WFG81129.1 hypothetical protein [Jatropha curcas]